MRITESKAYQEVLYHRKHCHKWANEFCIDCFGGGLIMFTENLMKELKEAK